MEDLREVDFQKYCPDCKHEKLKENEDPCNECLGIPANQHTDKPVNWTKKDKIKVVSDRKL